MKKIGFIDYYLDEWHANNYPQMIKDACGDEMAVCYAWGKIDAPGGRTNKQWAETYGVELLGSMEEVIEKSDYLILLSPDNPEMHEELALLPTASGKRLYIDKTFAPDAATAKRIFERADKYGTPCYSSSALHFSEELQNVKKEDVEYISSFGSGDYEIHSIHQIEQIAVLMGGGAESVMYTGTEKFPSFKIRFSGARYADAVLMPGRFRMHIGYRDGKAADYTVESPFFAHFIENMLEFFRTGEIPVSHSQTVEVIAIREASIRARNTPFVWVDIQK